MDYEITLNSLEHFCFCKYQWWLNYIENEWMDNIHTTLGNIVHSKVDDRTFIENRNGVEIRRSVPVFSNELNLYGIADLVEYDRNKGLKINVVEYKKGKPKDNGDVQDFDGLQLFAQMVCLKEIHKCEVNGYIFYDSIKRRIKLKDEPYFKNLLLLILNEMRQYIKNKSMPPKNIDKHCRACSVYEICLPYIGEKNA